MIEDFDHHSERFARDHHEFYRRVRAGSGTINASAYGGFTVLTRYADVRSVLRDHGAFSSARFHGASGVLEGGVAIPPNGTRIGIIEMDPPEATRLRELLKPWFSIAAVEAAAPRIAELAEWVVDGFIENGECDVVRDLAKPMPTLLIMDVLGLPLERWAEYGHVLHEAVAKAPGSMDGLRWLIADLREKIEGRSCHSEGLIAYLQSVELEGRPLHLDLVCELSMMLLFGGSDTTIAALAHALLHLSEHSEDRRALLEDPSLVAPAVEEFLRLHTPTTVVARTVACPVTMRSLTFAPGDRVLCAINSANRDEAAFERPDAYDPDRPRRPHLAFGTGVHTCLGQHLARADIRIVLTEVLKRLPDFRVETAAVRPYTSMPLVSGFSAMPMQFTPSPATQRSPRLTPDLASPRLRPV